MIGEPAPSPLNFATPSGDPGVTHPSVVHAPGGFAGYPYWLALTPYNGHNDADENPCIYRSHDGNEWAPISGNPIAPTPAWGHHSDTYLLHDADVLTCVWRISSADNGTEILCSSTTDGETWTAPATMWRDAARFLLSPSVVKADGQWRMFTVERIVGAPNVVRHHVADTLTGPWTDAPCSGLVAQPSREAWHLNVVRDATGTWHALLNDTAHEVNGSGGGLFHATSTDGEAWVTDLSTCIPTSSSWHSSLYQGASVPTESGLDVWYSSRTPAWRIGRTSIAQPESPPPTTEPAPEVQVRLPVAPMAGQAYPMRLHVGDNAYVGQATIDPFMQGDGIVTFGVLASAHVPFAPSGNITYRNVYLDASDATTYTFSSADIGAADANRRVIVGIVSRAGGTIFRNISSVTIGGVSATIDVGHENDDGGNTTVTAFARATVPTGSTGDVVVTFDGAMARCGIAVWSADGAVTLKDSRATNLDTNSYSLTSVAGGKILAVAMFNNSGGATFTSPAVERFDTTLEVVKFAGADQSCTTTSTTFGFSYSASATWQALLSASYGL